MLHTSLFVLSILTPARYVLIHHLPPFILDGLGSIPSHATLCSMNVFHNIPGLCCDPVLAGKYLLYIQHICTSASIGVSFTVAL